MNTAIIWPKVQGVAIMVNRGMTLERLGELLGALAIVHAAIVTGSMNHAALDGFKELWMEVFVRPACPDDRVNLRRVSYVVSICKDD